MTDSYVATLNRTDRAGWSVVFRHPATLDRLTGRPRRIRRGLATRDEAEARKLVDELNELLADSRYWSPRQAEVAAARFDPRVVGIFFSPMEPEPRDAWADRDANLPLPGADDGYRRVLLLGTTGAGKTTVVRQLIGTDVRTERFPSTSTAKTTVADTEVICAPNVPFSCVVTFVRRDEVRDALEECISAAVLAASKHAGQREVLRRLLQHPDQRFRFNYTLGRGPVDVQDDDEETTRPPDPRFAVMEARSRELISSALETIHELASDTQEGIRSGLGDVSEDDSRVFEELYEDALDSELRGIDRFHLLVDRFVDAIEERFQLLESGTLAFGVDGWPQTWTWMTEERATFLSVVATFTSNYAEHFGRLLTPLVNGVRVQGPFKPQWMDSIPRLVLLDGEGLGHTPDSTAALSVQLVDRFNAVDAILLVDNATQPMQAASVAALRAVVSSGSADKLLLAFTHFDGVEGPNLPTFADKREHVVLSAENVVKSVGEQLGPQAERALNKRLAQGAYFLANVDKRLDASESGDRRTILEFVSLVAGIGSIGEEVYRGPARPVYEQMHLVLGVRNAAERYQDRWGGLLGRRVVQGTPKEHWARIKALARRFAGGGEEYLHLRPVSDLADQLRAEIYRLVSSPTSWEGGDGEVADDDKRLVYDRLANEVSGRITVLARRRIRMDRQEEWTDAYNESGYLSSYRRAEKIDRDILNRAAPVPDVVPAPNQNEFLHEVVDATIEAAKEVNARFE